MSDDIAARIVCLILVVFMASFAGLYILASAIDKIEGRLKKHDL